MTDTAHGRVLNTAHALLVAVAVALVAQGCASGPRPALTPQVHRGPGQATRPIRVLALSASCGSVEFPCPREYVDLVNNIVRSSMDFAGYALVEPEQLRNETRERQETYEHEVEENKSKSKTTQERTLAFDRTTKTESESRSERQKSVVVLDGPTFDDLTVTERQQVLAQADADSVLTVRIVVGAAVGVWSPDQSVEVMVKLGVDQGQSLAWASRCSASSNDFDTVNSALEQATRCAVFGGTGN